MAVKSTHWVTSCVSLQGDEQESAQIPEVCQVCAPADRHLGGQSPCAPVSGREDLRLGILLTQHKNDFIPLKEISGPRQASLQLRASPRQAVPSARDFPRTRGLLVTGCGLHRCPHVDISSTAQFMAVTISHLSLSLTLTPKRVEISSA